MNPPDLVADLGATHARFALVERRSTGPVLREPLVLRCDSFAGPQDAARHYLAASGVQPRRAAFAVASPDTCGNVRMTNRGWSFEVEALRQTLGVARLMVLNDVAAVAWAVPALRAGERETLHGDPSAPLVGPVSVIAPGTGLGIALLVGDGVRGWQVVATEGGHATFAPIGDEERAIARWLDARHGRTSNERLLSGAGIAQIDAALAAGTDSPILDQPAARLRDPAAIVAAALAGHDSVARRTLARFCAVLGSVAGDTALLHGARTVLIAGGIVPRFIPFLRASAFRERFLAKGRFATWLEPVAIHVVTHPLPGLLGAALALGAAEPT